MATASTHVRHAHDGDIPLPKESGWYSHVVYARPDLRYITPLDVALLRNLSDNELYTPEWGCWTGFNAVWNQILTRRRGLRRIRSSNHWLISTGTTIGSPRAGHGPRPRSACAWTSCRELPSCRSRTRSGRGASTRRVWCAPRSKPPAYGRGSRGHRAGPACARAAPCPPRTVNKAGRALRWGRPRSLPSPLYPLRVCSSGHRLFLSPFPLF